MLTPLFDVEQNAESLLVTIKAPLAKTSSTEISIDDNQLFFSSRPYFLRLHLPKKIKEDGKETVEYDVDSGVFKITVSKEIYGEFFPGLDLVTKLLTPCGRDTAKPLVEELNDAEGDLAADGTTFFEQQIPADNPSTSFFKYGFANCRCDVFSKLRDEIGYIIDVPDPDNLDNDARKKLAFQNESEKFSDDHYLADLFSPDELMPSTSFKAWWEKAASAGEKFSSDEKDRLKDLPKKSFGLFSDAHVQKILYSLLDILFAYVYNYRTTSGENNSESGWLISKLSPTLSCLVSWDNLAECLAACVRRSLCFPLCRSWDLSMKILQDVRKICKLGRIAVIKCFLDIHKIFANSGEYRYILNDLYITDYCVWLQLANEQYFEQLAEEIDKTSVNKKDTGLDLEELEMAGRLAMEEDESGSCFDLHQNLNIGERTLLEYVKRHAVVKDDVENWDSDDSDGKSDKISRDVLNIGDKISGLKFS